MSKTFLLIFKTSDGPRQEILDHLDSLEIVDDWYAFFPSAILVISEEDADDLSESFMEEFPERQHLFVETTSDEEDTQGWLDEEAWGYINSPN